MLKRSVQFSTCAFVFLAGLGLSSMKADASNFRMVENQNYQATMMAYGSCVENTQGNSVVVDDRLDAIKETIVLEDMLESVIKGKISGNISTDGNQNAEALKEKSLVVANVNNYINVRSIPSEKGEIVGKLYKDGVGIFLGEEDGWYEIESGSVHGYVRADLVYNGVEADNMRKQVGTKMARVKADGLYIRKSPDKESSILGMVANADELIVLAQGEGWVKVDTEFGEGWAFCDYLELYTEYSYAESIEEEKARLEKEKEERKKALEAAQAKMTRNNGAETVVQEAGEYTSFIIDPSTVSVVGDSELGIQVAQYGMQFIGNPYVYGGTSLTEGADCSGFVMSVYNNFGVDLPHSSAADRQVGSQVNSLEEAQAGDLICYSGHVAIYIGNGNIVHAANEKSGIVISPADYKQILAIRRIF